MPKNNVIWNTPQGYRPGTLSDTLTSDALDDATQNESNVLEDWLYPNRKEERQLGQQIALMYEEPSIRMDAMKKVGINPLTAAAGIAGASPSSSPQPSSSVNPIGDVAGAVGSVASGYGALANGVSTLAKLQPEIDEINSNSKKNLASAGLDKVNTDAVMTDNKYRDENWKADLNVKRQSFSNMKQELSNMKAQHAEIYRHIDEMLSQIELNGSQMDYYETMKLKLDEDLRWQKALNDWCLQNNLMIRDSGVDGYIFNMLYNEAPEGDVNAFFDAYYDFCLNRSYASSKGSFDAEIDTAYERAYNDAKGKAEVDSTYAPYLAKVDLLKSVLEQFASACMSNNISSVRDALGKIFNIMFEISGLDALGIDTKNPAGSLPSTPPAAGNVNRSRKYN